MSEEEVRYVRQMTNESSDEHYPDDAIQQLIDNHGLIGTIVRIWRDRAARFSALADVSDSGARHSFSQLYDHARKQLAYWENVLSNEGTGSSATRVSKIVRSDYDAG